MKLFEKISSNLWSQLLYLYDKLHITDIITFNNMNEIVEIIKKFRKSPQSDDTSKGPHV